MLLVNKVDLLTDAEESFRIGAIGTALSRCCFCFAPPGCNVLSACPLRRQRWTGASFEKMATECGFNSWYITSAKTDHNITEGMHFLIQEILAVGEEAQNAL